MWCSLMKRGTPDHPKTLALQAALKCSRPAAVGLLELLWHWTARYAQAGDVGRWSNGALAAAVGWDGDPDALVAALVASGWLDEREDCRLYVHDWSHHADDAVKLALYRAVKTFADGTAPTAHRISAKERERLDGLWAQRAHNVPTPCAQPEPRRSLSLSPANGSKQATGARPTPAMPPAPAAPELPPPEPPERPRVVVIDGLTGKPREWDGGPWFPTPESRRAAESEALRLAAQAGKLHDTDPPDEMARAASYPGARLRKVNPATMTHDRLVNTLAALRERCGLAKQAAADEPFDAYKRAGLA